MRIQILALLFLASCFVMGCSGVNNIDDLGSLNRPVQEPVHSGVGGGI
jgi:hypothetical protein